MPHTPKRGRKNPPGFLDPHVDRIAAWLAEGLSQAEVVRRLGTEQRVSCTEGQLSTFVRLKQLRKVAPSPGATEQPLPAVEASPVPVAPAQVAPVQAPSPPSPSAAAPAEAPRAPHRDPSAVLVEVVGRGFTIVESASYGGWWCPAPSDPAVEASILVRLPAVPAVDAARPRAVLEGAPATPPPATPSAGQAPLFDPASEGTPDAAEEASEPPPEEGEEGSGRRRRRRRSADKQIRRLLRAMEDLREEVARLRDGNRAEAPSPAVAPAAAPMAAPPPAALPPVGPPPEVRPPPPIQGGALSLPPAPRLPLPAALRPPLPPAGPARNRWDIAPPFAPLQEGVLWPVSLPLLFLGGEEEGAADALTLQDFCENFLVTGATGSGKSSGSGRALADAMLAHGFGGLVLTVKPDERRRWEQYMASVGRSEHLVVVHPGGPWRLNFLDYATKDARQIGDGVEEVVELFHVALDSHARANAPQMDGGFWERSGKQLLRNAVRVLRVARGRIVLEELLQLVCEAPASRASAENERWRETRLFGPALEEAERLARGTEAESMIAQAKRYWLQEFAGMRDGQRAAVISQITSLSDVLFQPGIRELLCAESTLLPEAATRGAVILIDLPLLDARVGAAGAFVQSTWKHLFQRAVQSRRDADGPSRRPVFLWADEAQYFVSPHDSLFASTSRSSRCSIVMLTQNLPNLYAVMGGGSAQHQVDGLLGNLVTKVIHANTDPTTNRWASELIGQSERWDVSVNMPAEDRSFNASSFDWMKGNQAKAPSTTSSRKVEPDVRPEQFLRLATGGEQYGFEVEAYVVRGGRTFAATGKHYLPVKFTQEV